MSDSIITGLDKSNSVDTASRGPNASANELRQQHFTFYLNVGAALILASIIILFGIWLCRSIFEHTAKKEVQVNLSFQKKAVSLPDSSIIAVNKKFITDLNFLKDTLNLQIEKLQSLKKDINEGESRNSDLFKLLLALIGTVFAIVGFFGFKSINDAREAALKNAVAEAIKAAESKAKEIADIEAKKISGEKAEKVATKVAQDIATEKAEKETNKYLDQKFPDYFRRWEETYKRSSDEQFADIFERINKLERPEAYGIEDTKLKELSDKYIDLLSTISALKLKEIKKDLE